MKIVVLVVLGFFAGKSSFAATSDQKFDLNAELVKALLKIDSEKSSEQSFNTKSDISKDMQARAILEGSGGTGGVD